MMRSIIFRSADQLLVGKMKTYLSQRFRQKVFTEQQDGHCFFLVVDGICEADYCEFKDIADSFAAGYEAGNNRG